MGFFSDIGNAISSAAGAVGDAVEGAANAVGDAVEDAVNAVVDTAQDGIGAASEWLCKNAGVVGCVVGSLVGGVLDGILQGLQELAVGWLAVYRGVFALVGPLLRLDLPGLIKALGQVVIDAVAFGINLGRFVTLGYVVGGIVKHGKRARLIRFVDGLVDERFGDDPERLAAVRERIGLDDGRFGLRLPADHRAFVLDSADVDLWRLHEEEVIDLYAMAGLLSFDSFSLGASHPNVVVTSVGDDGTDNWWPVTRWTIAKYLESRGESRRLRVYSISERAAEERMDVASRKLDDIGVILDWKDGRTTQAVTEAEYDFDSNGLSTLLTRPEFDRPRGVNCDLVALCGFKLDGFGRVAARNIRECEDFPDDCATPGRTDRCCNTIDRGGRSGVIYRDVYPAYVFQYVLPHEIGHYLGLCHCGHDGFQNVMFRPDVHDFLDFGLLSFYWDSEPHFSLEDGENAWRFIVDQMIPCLTGEDEDTGPIEILREKRRSALASTPDSCAADPSRAAGRSDLRESVVGALTRALR